MPCISRFHGVAIYIYARDHNPPHFHAKCAGQDVAIEIDSLEVIVGRLDARAMGFVRAWARLHQAELLDNWSLVGAGEPPAPIAPLP